MITVQYRQMDPAVAEAGLLPHPGASHPSFIPMEIGFEAPCSLRQPVEIGYEVPCSLRQSYPPSEVHAYPPPRIEVPPKGALALHPVIQGDQLVGQWVRAPSVAPGVPSSSSVPAAKQEGFIAEAWGTGPTVDADHVPPCLVDAPAPSPGSPTQASGVSAESKYKKPLFKLDKFNGSTSSETYLRQFEQLVYIFAVARKRQVLQYVC